MVTGVAIYQRRLHDDIELLSITLLHDNWHATGGMGMPPYRLHDN